MKLARLAPRTIQGRVALLAFLLLALVLGVVAFAVSSKVARSARRALDRRLASEAEALASLARFDGKRVALEFEDEIMTAYASAESGAYFQVSTEGGLVERSRSLGAATLPLPPRELYASLATLRDRRTDIAWVAGPKGRVRVFTLAVSRGAYRSERQEEEEPDSAPRLTVVVQVARDGREIDAALDSAEEALGVALPLALALGTLGVFLVARRATAPIARLARQASEIGAGSLDRRLDLASVDGELLDLARTLNEAFDRLAGAIERERRFSSDVAHELRTPLAITRTTLELALARDRSPDEYRAAIRESLEAHARLEEIVSALLVLARAESVGLERRPLDLRDVTAAAVHALEPAASRAGVPVALALPDAPCPALGHATLLSRLVSNLVENALRHGASPAGIEVALESEAASTRLVVRDRGPGFPEGFIERAFDRFARAEESRARGSGGGAGLGLSIVRAIARAHGAEVAARGREGGGAELAVSFPRLERP